MRRIPTTVPALFALVAAGLCAPSDGAAQAAQSLSVAEAVVTTDVQNREPADDVSAVPADVGEVYLWTRITGAQGEVEVSHVWYHADEEMARVPLTVAGTSWRTWSSKQIVPRWTGSWRVEVVGPDGQVLETVNFQVQGTGS